jgi:hypothetical protein
MLGLLALVPTFGPLVASLTGVWMGYLSLDPALSATEVCRALEHAVSNATAVRYYPGVAEAPVDIARWSNPSTHPSACSIAPGSDKDLATVVSKITWLHRIAVIDLHVLSILASSRWRCKDDFCGHGRQPGSSPWCLLRQGHSHFFEAVRRGFV